MDLVIAVEQRTIQGSYRVHDAAGSEENESIRLTEVKPVGVIHDVVQHVAMGLHDALGLSGGSRGVQNPSETIR